MDVKAAVREMPAPDLGEEFHLPVCCPIETRWADEKQLIYLDDAVGLTQKLSHLVWFTEEFGSFHTDRCSGSSGIG